MTVLSRALMLLALCLGPSRVFAGAATSDQPRRTIRTPTGYYTGKIDGNFSNVLEFLSVPYGQSTAAKNRFQPPKAVPLSSRHFDATEYAEACPQYVSSSPSIWNQQIPQYLQYTGLPNNTAGEAAAFTTEDCLKLAIWTPANATSESMLPVALFWTGGGFQSNGILVPGQLPQLWISLSQSHIVVTINYRLGIFGFPGSAGVYDQNLALLDQRLSLEWVRDNIAHFGGNPGNIMIWGQSAGAASVDYHNYAFWEDPIASSLFAESGSVLAFPPTTNWDYSNFTFVARNVGCNFPSDAQKELECMQKVPFKEIVNFIGRYGDKGTSPGIGFNPVVDERLVFSDYPARYKSGMVTKAPMIYSSAANEGGSLSAYPLHHLRQGPNQTEANAITESIICGAANSSILRDSIGLTTYRYQYAGNWSNQDPLPWMGAYHSSDLVMLFGTYPDGEGPVKEALEGETSRVMEDLALAFLKDPYNGPAAAGWPQFNTSASNGGTMLRFGANGKTKQEVDAHVVQAVCFGNGPYNPFP